METSGTERRSWGPDGGKGEAGGCGLPCLGGLTLDPPRWGARPSRGGVPPGEGWSCTAAADWPPRGVCGNRRLAEAGPSLAGAAPLHRQGGEARGKKNWKTPHWGTFGIRLSGPVAVRAGGQDLGAKCPRVELRRHSGLEPELEDTAGTIVWGHSNLDARVDGTLTTEGLGGTVTEEQLANSASGGPEARKGRNQEFWFTDKLGD